MSATQAKSGFGTLFQRGDGATPTEAFTTVAEIKNIRGPEEILETVDATHMESPQGFRERVTTLLDAGQIVLAMQFVPGDTSQNNIRNDQRNKVRRNFRIVFPGASLRFEGQGYVTNIGNEYPLDNVMTRDTTIQCTGPWNIVAHP